MYVMQPPSVSLPSFEQLFGSYQSGKENQGKSNAIFSTHHEIPHNVYIHEAASPSSSFFQHSFQHQEPEYLHQRYHRVNERHSPSHPSRQTKTGRWTMEEQRLFVEGLKLHGKDWKKIGAMIPTRTLVQIRTHAQKMFQKTKKNKELVEIRGSEHDVMLMSSADANLELDRLRAKQRQGVACIASVVSENRNSLNNNSSINEEGTIETDQEN